MDAATGQNQPIDQGMHEDSTPLESSSVEFDIKVIKHDVGHHSAKINGTYRVNTTQQRW
jgi:hypothetical protein